MEQILPPDTLEGAGFEPPRVRQFTVFTENKVGQLQLLVRAYEQAGGRVVALSILDAADTALIRLIGHDADLVRETLQQEEFSFTEQELLAVELPKNTRQPLQSLCSVMLSAEINIHYAYPLLVFGSPVLALSVEDPVLAAQLLIRKGFRLIADSDLKK